MKKERVDVLLVSQGLFETREKAKRAVMAGEILGENEERLDKPGSKIPVETELHFKGKPMPYVSRGGLKLEKALKVFKISVQDKIVLDIGSSTGGFTDVMLQNGAQLSYALDVGTNQLVWKLREDPRVVVMENTNFRYAKLTDFTHGQPEFASIDVSFISLKLILPALKDIIKSNGGVVALIKPQFEAGKDKVGKHGIIHDPKVHEEVLTNTLNMAVENGYNVVGLDFSPIKGGEGNIEFLMHIVATDGEAKIDESVSIKKTLESAYAQLNQTKED
ncbi:TlyA family RNA methyltransferase [Pediococcus inopinatus]|uniref:TlyA family RNA methyltransferase n=1 Tax=Pediococcus inopinatus TaxID=114090 RepID=A0ABZ0Q695_9LACO|nr:TlyA family RNA methyltransferase [Pediococcus inopinatus]AVK99807.1 TlyA family rRNA (cytidine-2'-O)-methyltransferase [Pediococcus inopinatus]KRN63273.1 hemolysin-like protein [Pediococcus inopinatus]WPC17533.1 TlyA family RNA methyltransferase [Pediococcus inopinatus]WPC18906.1 TlyA family RNA methyltransferase [Pediococcus inopinatus]WPC22525.1 TlyA family RNA methyltransferase [Pediococcus inopinatus]